MMPQNERRDWPLTVEESVWMGVLHTAVGCFRIEVWIEVLSRTHYGTQGFAPGSPDYRTLRWRVATNHSWPALAQQAQVLLLDEPTAGLDLKYQVDVLRLIRELANRQQLTVVLSLHDLNLAAIFGNRIALLSNGQVSAFGSPNEVLRRENIGSAYGVSVTVARHPVHNTPLVVPLPDASLTESS